MIVDTEKVLREADGSVKLVVVRPHTDGKVFAPGCASKPDGESREEPEEHKRFNDISCEGKGNKQQCLRDADFVKTFARRFGIGQWSFIGPGSEKKWYPSENSPQGEWDRIAEDMLLKFAESGHPIFRATTPLSRGKLKSKGKGKVSIHFSAEPDTIDTIYRINGSYMRGICGPAR